MLIRSAAAFYQETSRKYCAFFSGKVIMGRRNKQKQRSVTYETGSRGWFISLLNGSMNRTELLL